MTSVYPEVESVAGLLVNRRGDLLLQLRDDKPGIANPGCWGLPGGAVEPGERPADAFAREMFEEIGCCPEFYALYGSFAVRRGGPPVAHIYAGLLDRPAESLTVGEGQGFAFWPPGALPQPLTPLIDRLVEGFVASDVYRNLTR